MLKSINLINSDATLNSSDRDELIPYLMLSMDQKENDLQRHSDVVQKYLIMLAKEYFKIAKEEISQQSKDLVSVAGMLHDIGKIFIENDILNSQKKFEKNDYEFKILMEHPIAGYHALNMCNATDLACAVLYHHKWFNGEGYIMPPTPQYEKGLSQTIIRKKEEEFYKMKELEKTKGKDIPVVSRMISVADVFDAITSLRPYKQKQSGEHAYKEMLNKSGTQFDPDIIRAFVNIKQNILKVLAEYDLKSMNAIKEGNIN